MPRNIRSRVFEFRSRILISNAIRLRHRTARVYRVDYYLVVRQPFSLITHAVFSKIETKIRHKHTNDLCGGNVKRQNIYTSISFFRLSDH